MGTKEIVEFIETLKKLPPNMQREIYFMIKGAALVAEKAPKGA